MDETYVEAARQWRCGYRAIERFGQVIDVFVPACRDAKATRRFFERATGATRILPTEVTADQAPAYPAVLEELLPAAWHRTEQYGNNRVEGDHRRLKAPLRPMRGRMQGCSARRDCRPVCPRPERSVGTLRAAVEGPATRRLAVAFDELAMAI